MRKEYDFSKSKKNPYAKRFKRQITIRLDSNTIDYFKGLSNDMGIAYQVLIDLFLRECARSMKRPVLHWNKRAA